MRANAKYSPVLTSISARLICKRRRPFTAALAVSKRTSAEARRIAWCDECDTTPPVQVADLVLAQSTRNRRFALETAARGVGAPPPVHGEPGVAGSAYTEDLNHRKSGVPYDRASSLNGRRSISRLGSMSYGILRSTFRDVYQTRCRVWPPSRLTISVLVAPHPRRDCKRLAYLGRLSEYGFGRAIFLI